MAVCEVAGGRRGGGTVGVVGVVGCHGVVYTMQGRRCFGVLEASRLRVPGRVEALL